MTQYSLSVVANELHEQAVADFKVSERFAYSFIMKVKKIRDERLYRELGYSSFESYCEQAWNVKRGYIDDRILLAESFGSDFDRTYGQIGHSKSLLLARMDPTIRKEVETSIDVSESTVRELKDLEKQLQDIKKKAAESEESAIKAQNTALHFEKLWKQTTNQKPQVITETKIVEKVPEDYDDLKQQAKVTQQLNTEVVQLKRANETMRQTYEEKLSQQQKHDASKRDLQKYLAEHLRALTMNHDSAIFNYSSIQGDREAHDIVMRFLDQYEKIVKQQFAEWQQLTTIRAIN